VTAEPALASARLVSLSRQSAGGTELVALVLGTDGAAVVRDASGEAEMLGRADAMALVGSLLQPAPAGLLAQVPDDLAHWLAAAADVLELPGVSGGVRALVTVEVADAPDAVRTATLVHLASGASLATVTTNGVAGPLAGGDADEVAAETLAALGLGTV